MNISDDVVPQMYEFIKDIYDSLTGWWDLDCVQRDAVIRIVAAVEGEGALDKDRMSSCFEPIKE